MIVRPTRVVLVGGIVVEIAIDVTDLVDRGGTVRADRTLARAGGRYPVLLAARRLGLQAAYAGWIGTAPSACLLDRALAREGIDALLGRKEGEQGFVVQIVEPDGTVTSTVSPGVEECLTFEDLDGIRLTATDVAYLSCSDLIDQGPGRAVARWCAQPGGLGEARLVLDPGPLVADVEDDILDAVLARTDVIVLDEHELALISGQERQLDREQALADLLGMLSADALIVLRLGNGRHTLVREGGEPLDEVDDLLGELARLGHVPCEEGIEAAPTLSRRPQPA